MGSTSGDKHSGNFARIVRRRLAYRDDEVLDAYIEVRRSLTFMPGMPHENPMRVVVDQLRKQARRATPVVIQGPPGSGRQTAALVLRDAEEPNARRWSAVTCTAPDAQRHLTPPDGGCVLLLREVDRADVGFQRALLAMLDDPGTSRTCRVICTTSRDLEKASQDGTFDEALYRKLSLGTKIVIPPLTDRRWDIPPLIASLLNGTDRDSIQYISYAALLFFVQFDWPGQVEQLLSVLEALIIEVAARGGDTITFRDVIKHYRRVCLSPSTPFPQDESGTDDSLLWQAEVMEELLRRLLLQEFGSPEITHFFEAQYENGVFSDPQSDQEFEGGGWHKFDRDRWTGCIALTGSSHAAWGFNLYLQQETRVLHKPAPASEPDAASVEGESKDPEELVRVRERALMEELKQKVRPVVLDDSYGVSPNPSVSMVGHTTLVKLNFEPLFASPDWLVDKNWRLRDSWDVPLEWADSRITFSVKRMAEQLKDCLLIPGASDNLFIRGPTAVAPEIGTEVETAAQQSQYLFIFEGAAWKLAFGEDPFQVKDMKGLHYIAALLRSPNQWVSAPTLCGMIDNPGWIKEGHVGDNVPDESDEETSDHRPLAKRRHLEPVIDDQTRQQCTEELRKLRAKYDATMARNDVDAAEEIDGEIEKLEEYLGAATGLSGRTREFSDANTKTADAVSRVIRYAIDKIKIQNSPLANHLISSIEFGLKLRYAPETPIVWQVS